MRQQAVEAYVSQVRKGLICPRSQRERLLRRVEEMAEELALEQPELTLEDLNASFGPAEVFAGELLSTLPPETVAAARKRRKCLLAGVLSLVIGALLALCLLYIYKYRMSQSYNENATVIIFPAQEITEEEFEKFWNDTPESAHSGLWPGK